MNTLQVTVVPRSAFGTPPKGDTLFGQLCWALRNRLGEARLVELLDGYTADRPFAVLSDALPAGYLPRPVLPAHWFKPVEGDDRKTAKKRVWLPAAKFAEPMAEWLRHCVPSAGLPGGLASAHPHPHNAIDRRTGTTGADFAPYTLTRHWYGKRGEAISQSSTYALIAAQMEIYIVLDETRLRVEELSQALADMGELGFGRDAGIGLGRFVLNSIEEYELADQPGSDAWLALAPCAPQGQAWDMERSFYSVFTRFGRHGDIGVHLGNPFKTPVLLANTGAVLVPTAFESRSYIGRGLGGDGSLSKSLPQTVQQGYAPVVGIQLPQLRDTA